MADFTALKNSIRNYIKQNGNAEITGEVLQNILISMVVSMGDGAINGIADGLANEGNARTNADGLLQNAINSISTALGDGYTYAGIATPATTPTSGRVFYLALQAGTYTNFGGIVVTQEINILKNNDGTWQLDNVIGIDDIPTAGSPNLVKSGGAFANMGAFDISDYNKSGSTLATYADLTAALAALPSEYQKGGMSVKFIQSSDNKYVQFFCTADEFTTDVTKWQGVDDEPTAGSDNLVKSGGIYGAISYSPLIVGNDNLEIKKFFLEYYCGRPYKIYVIAIYNGEASLYGVMCRIYNSNDEVVWDNYFVNFSLHHEGIGSAVEGNFYIHLTCNWDALPADTYIPVGHYLNNNNQSVLAKVDYLDFSNNVIRPVIDLTGSGFMADEIQEITHALVDVNVVNALVAQLKIVRIVKGQTPQQSYITYYSNYDGNISIFASMIDGVEILGNDVVQFMVDWNALSTRGYEIDKNVNGFYLKEHYGQLYFDNNLKKPNIIDFETCEQFFVKNGELHGNSNHRFSNSSVNHAAKYYKVDLGSKIKKVMCKFIAGETMDGLLMLITTSLNSYGRIADITKKSNHTGFSNTSFSFSSIGDLIEHEDNHTIIFNPALTPGQEYQCGYEFLGNNQIKAYLPDGTEQTFTVDNIDICNGQYFIMEYYYAGFSDEAPDNLNNWYPICKGICVECEDGYNYIDDFTQDGLLRVSPSGHVYTTFRNRANDDTIYSVTGD